MIILDESDRESMRTAGRFNAQLMDAVRDCVKPGASLDEIDQFVHRYTLDHGHVPAPLNYRGFPKSCCISVNEVVCHGIPNSYVLRDGDIVNVDVTTIVDGWHGDQSETFSLGDVSAEAAALVQCSLDCLYIGIAAARPFGRIRDIGTAITSHAHAEGFSVVRMFQGHGIGRNFHTAPGIPHFPDTSENIIVPGMCFTVEPMVNAGSQLCLIDKRDGWTARTQDGRLSAQFEHTLLMGDDGPEILTLTKHGPQPSCFNLVPNSSLVCGTERHGLRRYCSPECAERESTAELDELGITPEMMAEAMSGYYECKEMIERCDSSGEDPPLRFPSSSSPE